MYVLACASGGREANRSSLVLSLVKERRGRGWGLGYGGVFWKPGTRYHEVHDDVLCIHEIRLPILAVLCSGGLARVTSTSS